ncbi:hypothetical protein GAMM_60307 [Gammaproteobacteria bacterium]
MQDKNSIFKELKDGRSAYWNEESKTVVIRDPGHVDGGSVFKSSKRYFEGIE